MNDEILINENNQAKSFQEKIDSEKERLQKKFSGIEKDTQELLVNIRDQGLSYTDMMDVLRSVQDTYESMDIKYFAEKMTDFT